MAALLRRLSRAAPTAFTYAFNEQPRSNPSRLFPFGATAIAGGLACLYLGSSPSMVHLESQSGEDVDRVALNPEKWTEFKLQEKARVNHDSLLFRFSFDPATKFGLDVASCILTRAPNGENAEGKTKYVIRPYTPISSPDSKGHFDLLIKVYPEGKMSQHFASLKPGDVLEVKGPIEKLRYSPNMKKEIGMIAGGTGITPMLQIINEILKNPEDNTKVSLLYGNISPDDILLKEKLDILAASHPNLKVFYTVDNASKNWRGGSGYISEDMILKGLPAPGEDALILVCGPPGLMQHVSGEKAKDWTQGEVNAKNLLFDDILVIHIFNCTRAI
ncbi:NADH-cytochrome b5 reductase-like protein [Acorus gramineus]|uniref:NADH-cytochrome b5 reductase n=1 Tax=Acorus gramineus TaxID=55184 RepID=A0AAV9A4D1_ACOGR|nr:NADH-cytochrome b5 reductase-like protein [Acorus gramineus]